MLTRAAGAVTTVVVSAATLVLFSSPAQALDTVTPAPFVILRPDTYSAASCDFLASGPSADPARTPYHVAGTAVVVSRKIVVSTSLRCRLRLVDVDGRPQVGQTLAQAASGSMTTVAGDIVVDRAGRLEICTWFDAVFADTTRLNPNGTEECRLLTNPMAASYALFDDDVVAALLASGDEVAANPGVLKVLESIPAR